MLTNNVIHAVHEWYIYNENKYLSREEIINMPREVILDKFLEWEGIIGYNYDINSIFEK